MNHKPIYLTASQAPAEAQDADQVSAPTTEPAPTEPAADAAPRVTLALQADIELDTEKRTISGLILPYAVLAQRSSAGVIRFAAGSLKTPKDLKRIKLLVDHDAKRSVGYCTKIDQDDDGVRATFHLPEGDPAADEALAKAGNGVRDGLSIGADLTMHHKSADGVVTEVTEALLNETSLVSLPAFSDSRVHTVRASQDTTPDDPAPVIVQATAPYTGQANQVTAAQLPSIVATALANGGGAAQVTAALADIVPANDAGQGFIGQPAYIGELWQADDTDTPLVDAISKGPLTGTKIHGWKWNVKPQVAPYTGNKAEIPTNAVSTVPAEADAQRLAAGWDVDRIYLDLGDASFINSVFTAATADFKRKLEAAVATALAAGATTVAASATVTAALAKLGTVAGQLGSSLNVIAMAPDIWAAFTELPATQVPWWLQRQGDINLGDASGSAGGLRFAVNHGLAAGQMLAFDRRAAKLHQPTTNPIRVQALDIAKGGVDLGVYGYYGLMIHDARAILLTSVAGV